MTNVNPNTNANATATVKEEGDCFRVYTEWYFPGHRGIYLIGGLRERGTFKTKLEAENAAQILRQTVIAKDGIPGDKSVSV